MARSYSARQAKALIRQYLKHHAETERDRRAFFLELRRMSRSIRWTPHLFDTVMRHYTHDFERGAGPAIFLAKDILQLASFEDAAALVCTEAAKDPDCHPLLRGRASFGPADYYGDFWNANSLELQRSIVTYLNRAVANRLRPKQQIG